MDKVNLMNRVDTKFIFNINRLATILSKATESYNILRINNKNLFSYKTTYFDTDDLSMYVTHHNGKLNRFKIRYREYLDSNLEYFEIKFKSNKKRTLKNRLKQYNNFAGILEDNRDFITEVTPYSPELLKPKLIDTFTRFTLIHKKNNERLTCDLSLHFDDFQTKIELPYLSIIEIKQERYFKTSDFIKILSDKNIIKSKISKYCLGLSMLNENLKTNRFKRTILNLQKIKSDANKFN